MRILFIGGTGNISAACVRLAISQDHDVSILNRGQRPLADYGIPAAARSITGDISDEASVREALGGQTFDAVANFIAFNAADVERDIRLFSGRCAQYFFISSASAYEKPLRHPFVTESHPLKNPFWDYSRDKIAGEDACTRAYRDMIRIVAMGEVDALVVGIVPLSEKLGAFDDAETTGFANEIREISTQSQKPIVMVIDAGRYACHQVFSGFPQEVRLCFFRGIPRGARSCCSGVSLLVREETLRWAVNFIYL